MSDPLLDSPPPEDLSGGLAARWSRLSGNVRGAVLFILASVVFSVMIAVIKLIGERLHVTEVLFFRQIIMLLVALPVIMAGWPNSVRSSKPRLQVLRVVLAFFSLVLGFGAFVQLGLAEVTVLSFSKSYFLTILAILFLGETVSTPRWVALLVGFGGVLVVLWPAAMAGSDIGLWHVAAILSALCVAAVMVIIRILSRVDRPVTIMTYQAVGVGILLVPAAIWFWKTPVGQEWVCLVAIGVLSAAAQYLSILAFRVAEASALAPLEYLRLVFAAALGFLIFDEWPETRVWVGAVIIVGAALYVVQRERQRERRGRMPNGGQPARPA